VPSAREERPRPAACLNCGSTRVEDFCPRCGQRNVDMRIPARDLALDAIEDGLSLDSRVGRTVAPFLFRPGFLTVEWTEGRRARFSSPLRLYLLASFAFFLATSFSDDMSPRIRVDDEDRKAAVAEVKSELDRAGVQTGDDWSLTLGGDRQQVPPGTAEQHEKLREKGWIGIAIDERWKDFGRMSRAELTDRVNRAFREWVPRVMFFLVPAAVLVLALLWRRRWLSEHVVLALHLHAFVFTLLTVGVALRLLPWPGARGAIGAGLVAWSVAYYLLALRRVYGERWRWVLPKAAVAALLYLVALGLGLVGVAGLALWFA
jgi:hypothetical protein